MIENFNSSSRVFGPRCQHPGRLSVRARSAVSPSMTVQDTRADAIRARNLSDALLADETYHIEFQGYLSNHAKHAVVALHGLQAPPDLIQKYWDMYTHEVPYGWTLEPANAHSGKSIDEAGFKALLGKKVNYPELVEFFDKQVTELGQDTVVEKYAPLLVPGMAAALTHGLIHLGWALDFGSRRMLVEGIPEVFYYSVHELPSHVVPDRELTTTVVCQCLAYMAYTFLSVHPERFQHSALGSTSPVESLIEASNTSVAEHVPESIENIKNLPQYALERGWHPELHPAGFQWHLSKVLEEGHDIFLKLPKWLDTLSVPDALREMYKAVTLLYLVSAGEPEGRKMGDFVVLHLITSLWGAEKVIQNLPEEHQRDVLKCFWASMNAIVATTSGGFPPAATLEAAWDKFEAPHDSNVSGEQEGQGMPGIQTWEEIIARVYEEDEEHNIKLVYVSRQLWNRYDNWSAFRAAAEAFTPTPSVGPNATGTFSA